MTEEEARTWLVDNCQVSRETMAKLESFVAFLREEMPHQNLISKSSADHIWARHIVDSVQLLRFAPDAATKVNWLDLGSGAGFPGLVIAILRDWNVVLVESRRKRVEYLERAVAALDLDNVAIIGTRLEVAESFSADVISARAFAPLDKLLRVAHRFSTENSLWLLPKGRNAVKELEAAEQDWRLMFHVEHSVTDEEAGILVGKTAGPRRKR